jgi:RTX calcium-binding nonapeptide repeat (4 copies)
VGFDGFWGCIAPRRWALGLVVAVLVVVPGAGPLLSGVSAASSQQKRPAVRAGRHEIRGGPGNAVIRGRGGNDVIHGGRGSDRIYGASGNDWIYGGRGNDRIDGGPGNDRIDGGSGNDWIYGGRGNDRSYGGAGNDFISVRATRSAAAAGATIGSSPSGGATTVFPGSGTNQVEVADGQGNDRVVCAAGAVDHITADRGDAVAHGCLGNGSTVSYGGGGVSKATWMHDLGSQLWSRKLSDIVIPGSHDTGTYALPDDPISLIGKAQTEDITTQLDDGFRSFDIRVKYSREEDPCPAGDYFARHGILWACQLTLSEIFDQISAWANLPGHEQEIILVGLSIDQNSNGPFPLTDCASFGSTLGQALLTPEDLVDAGYSADPGQVTLGQLWSMPGHPRVLLSDDTCMEDASLAGGATSGTWSPDPPFGSGAGQSYYANQCNADAYSEWYGEELDMPGIAAQAKSAAETRATQGGGDDYAPGDAETVGAPMNGGLWTLFLQATPTWACTKSLGDFDLAQQEQVLLALYQTWWQNDPFVQANVNVISGDFVTESKLATDAIAINTTYPEVPGAITPVGTERVVTPSDAPPLPATDFAALVTDYTGAALPGTQVTYEVSGAPRNTGFGVHRDKTTTVTADAQGDINPGEALYLDPQAPAGTWTVTASAAGGVTATWTVAAVPPTGTHLVALAAGGTVQVGQTYDVPFEQGLVEGSFAVEAVDAQGHGVPGVSVTFDAGSAGTFPGGSNTVTVPTQYALGGDPAAVAPPLTAATQAATFSISISANGADNTLSLPFTLTPGPAASFDRTQGDGQSTPINTKFSIALQGQLTDQYGNAAPPPPGPVTLSLSPSSDGTWPNGQSSVQVTPDADGTITAPDLTAGNTVENNPPFDQLVVSVGDFGAWRLQVTPGPAAKVTAISSASQQPAAQTAAHKPPAHALAVKVTDARGHPIAGAPVIFTVTSGTAAFAPPNPRLVAAARIGSDQAPLNHANRPRNAVTEPTNGKGIATAPALTADPKAGPVEVTASVGVSHKVRAVLQPTVVSGVRHRSARSGVTTGR